MPTAALELNYLKLLKAYISHYVETILVTLMVINNYSDRELAGVNRGHPPVEAAGQVQVKEIELRVLFEEVQCLKRYHLVECTLQHQVYACPDNELFLLLTRNTKMLQPTLDALMNEL